MVLKTREKVLIGLAVLVGVVMGFDQFVTQPKKKEAVVLQKQVQEYNEKLTSVTTSLAALNPIKKRVEEIKKEKESFSGRISDDRQLGLLLDQLGKESQMKQMDLIHLDIKDDTAGVPAEDKSKPNAGSFKKVILETGLQTGYGNIGSYLDNIQSLPIFMQLEKVEIRRKEESFPKLEVTVQQVLYITSSPKKEAQGQGNDQPIRTSR